MVDSQTALLDSNRQFGGITLNTRNERLPGLYETSYRSGYAAAIRVAESATSSIAVLTTLEVAEKHDKQRGLARIMFDEVTGELFRGGIELIVVATGERADLSLAATAARENDDIFPERLQYIFSGDPQVDEQEDIFGSRIAIPTLNSSGAIDLSRIDAAVIAAHSLVDQYNS